MPSGHIQRLIAGTYSDRIPRALAAGRSSFPMRASATRQLPTPVGGSITAARCVFAAKKSRLRDVALAFLECEVMPDAAR